MKYYQTEWKRKDKRGLYTTKSLTKFHKTIHDTSDYAMTVEIDRECPTPFGFFSEVIAVTSIKNPAKNKAFVRPFNTHKLRKNER
jgi:hypothetical protein